MLCADVMNMVLIDGSLEGFTEVISSLREVLNFMQSVRDQTLVLGRGRPRIAVENNQLISLLGNGFRVKVIAEIMHCSKRTIE